jgi:hypothetical protein
MCVHSRLGVAWGHLPLARDSEREKRKRDHARPMTDAQRRKPTSSYTRSSFMYLSQ